MGLTEDQRQAATVKVSISTYIATSALAALAGAVALFTYVSQTYSPDWLFYGAMLLGAVCLVGSIVAGGKGANTTASKVAQATWTHDTKTRAFGWQALLALLGLAFLLLAVVVGMASNRQDSPLAARLDRVVREQGRVMGQVRARRGQLTDAEAAAAGLRTRVTRLENSRTHHRATRRHADRRHRQNER